jgi:hypothetical protein
VNVSRLMTEIFAVTSVSLPASSADEERRRFRHIIRFVIALIPRTGFFETGSPRSLPDGMAAETGQQQRPDTFPGQALPIFNLAAD